MANPVTEEDPYRGGPQDGRREREREFEGGEPEEEDAEGR
jgi:hypothetical protein